MDLKKNSRNNPPDGVDPVTLYIIYIYINSAPYDERNAIEEVQEKSDK